MVVTVASRLEAVTVYARGARVIRVASVAAPLPARVRFADLPLALIDDRVRVEVVGPALATSLHVDFESPATIADATADEPADVRAARQRLALAEAERERVEAALDQLAGSPLVAADPTDEPPAAWDAVVAARVALVGVRAARELQLREGLAGARAEIEDARLALEILVTREARLTSARGAKLHELRKVVEIELVASAGAGAVELRLEYQVRSARWAPSYVARLGERSESGGVGHPPASPVGRGAAPVIDDEGARVELRAVVAQSSGEDWLGASLVLSTAEPAQLAELPELAPQRIGRRQDVPARRGFRAPPQGAEGLYADFDRTRARPAPSLAPAVMESALDDQLGSESLANEVWDDGTSRAKEAFSTPPMGHPMMVSAASSRGGLGQDAKQLIGRAVPTPKSAPAIPSGAATPMQAAAPQAQAAYAAFRAPGRGGEVAKKRERSDRPEGGGGALARREEPMAAASVPRLDYAELRMPPPSAASRGRLEPAPKTAMSAAIATRIRDTDAALASLPLPGGCIADWAHTFDYAFVADGRVDVASDGAWHSLAITAKSATVALRHVAVPREQIDVFRVASITNPFDGPLLPGPIDVYDRGQFLVTSAVDATPPGGKVEIGLGVDATVKVARNIEYREEATGMLRGGLRLIHGVAIDVENLSARAIDLEVRERVPVSVPGDDAVEVTLGRVEPAWERWTPDPAAPVDERLRGGHRWRVAVAPKAKTTLRVGYEIKIASKLELVGGNRRES